MSLARAYEAGSMAQCARALGPYPFADGSLQILSADLLRAFVRSPLARAPSDLACATVRGLQSALGLAVDEAAAQRARLGVAV